MIPMWEYVLNDHFAKNEVNFTAKFGFKNLVQLLPFFLLPVLLSSIIFTLVPYASAVNETLEFNQDPHVIEHSGFIIYTNSSLANNNVTDTITASLTSDSDPVGISVELEEDENDDGILQSNYIKFTTSPSAGELLTAVDDLVQVSYDTLSDSATVVAASGKTISWDTANTDNNWTDCISYGGDTDGDGACNNWENQTLHSSNSLPLGLYINHPNGADDYYYPCDPSCPDPEYKDIFIEIDYMEGHRPNAKAIQDIIDTFRNSPVDNPNGTDGINLHIQIDGSDVIGHKDSIVYAGANHPRLWGFNQIKAIIFGTADERTDHSEWDANGWKQKKQVFKYSMFVHHRKGHPSASGVAELRGNDMMITMGSWAGQIGSTDEQEGTLMHELGHNLDLHHGGPDIINCKPNQLSVMNFAYQFSDLVSDRDLDYSHKAIGTMELGSTSLVENNLDENKGIGSYSPYPEKKIVYGPTIPLNLPTTNSTVDWNQDGDSTDSSITVNINRLDEIGCSSTDSTETLSGYNEWNLVVLIAAGSANWADGRPQDREIVDDEITIENVRAMRVLRLDALGLALQSLPDDQFHGKKSAKFIKNQQVSELQKIKELIMVDKMAEAKAKLAELGKGFGDIVNKKSKKYLEDGLGSIIKAYKKTIR